jgi:hypothetical protein
MIKKILTWLSFIENKRLDYLSKSIFGKLLLTLFNVILVP